MYQRTLLKHLRMHDIRPNVCGRRKCTPGFTNGYRAHPNFLLGYILQGKGTFSKEHATYQVKAGDLTISYPGQVSCFIADEKDPADRVWVSFECNCCINELLCQDVISMPSLAPIFLKISQCQQHNAKEWAVYALLFELFSRLADQQPSVNQPKDYVSQAVGIIENNYDQQLRVEEIAAELGLSRSYFCRIFREKMDVSPQEYIISYRLEKATELLASKKLTQKEVALQIGYPDVYAFSRMFKRKYGMSPGKYRSEKLMSHDLRLSRRLD